MRRFSLLVLVALAGCTTTRPYVAPERRADPVPALPDGPEHVVYLAGNTGDLEGAPVVLEAVARDARAFGDDATIVVLGDVTTDGLPPEGDPDRARAQAPVDALVDALSGLEAEIVVVPGDRDWRQGEDGVKRLEDVLEDGFDADVLTPGDQGGGPREDKLADGLRLIALDTAWWLLDPRDRPEGEAEDQDIRSAGDVARIFEQIVEDRDDDRIVVVAHHPLVSRGPRGGARGNPLAAIASRTVGTSGQDLSAPRYRTLRQSLGRIAAQHDRLVWAASHDAVLQTETDVISTLSQQVHLISGTAGGDGDAFSPGGDYVSARPGYQRLVYYPNGRLWTETLEVDAGGDARVVYRAEVAAPNLELVDDRLPDDLEAEDLPDNLGGTVTVAADADFVTEPFHNDAFTRAVFGVGYRDVWKTPVEFEVFDIGTEAGGLTPVKKGGGLQTTGLRLVNPDGQEYGLRLLEKSGLAQVPLELRDGLVGDIVLDLRSSMVPYGALVASPLARAAGIAQPDPRIVWIPDDPRLGRYRETFGNRLALFEVRPDDDMSAVPGFEGMTDVISSGAIREELREDQDHRVDQRTFLRARLLDMLIADWDRHLDQWRWAAFEPGDLDPALEGDEATRGKVYVPIARDRDFAYYGLDGPFQAALAAWDNRLQPIDFDYGSIEGLTHNGFFQDRRFLNELDLEEWRAIARDLQSRLTDRAIEDAVRALPDPIYDQVSENWIAVTKSRRDKLVEAAEAYYAFHAPIVDVVGSDEREQFRATRLESGRLEVVVRSFKGGEPGAELYRRTFRPDETDEVRLYGFGARDAFEVVGDGPRDIAVRIIGGAGGDVLDASGGNVAVYDTPDGLEVGARGRGLEDRRSDDPDVNRYDETEQVIGDAVNRPAVGYRDTDGLIVGASRTWLVPGFRLRPYAAVHTVTANVATATGGVAARYHGHMREALGRSDLEVEAYGSTPRYARNFYGIGNGSPQLNDSDRARVDLGLAGARAGLVVPLGENLALTIGPTVRYADATPPRPQAFDPGNPDLPLVGPAALLPDLEFEAQTHVGASARVEARALDLEANPRQGLGLSLFGDVRAGVSGPSDTYGRVGGEAVAYLPLRVAPQLTLALRAGGETTLGGFPFWDASVLGGPGTLRGYRRERFAGRTAASASAELRAKLLDFDAYVLPLDIGVLGFADAGRVWGSSESLPLSLGPATFPGDDLQLGYGGGLWVGSLDRGVATFTVGASDEAVLVTFGVGFAY